MHLHEDHQFTLATSVSANRKLKTESEGTIDAEKCRASGEVISGR